MREWYGKPIYVNSGYRCPELNQSQMSRSALNAARTLAGHGGGAVVPDPQEDGVLYIVYKCHPCLFF